MTLKTLFRPTKGRIALFLLLFFLIGAIDTNLRPFQNSPLLFKFWTTGAPEFLIYLLILPYLLSCILPAFLFRGKGVAENKPSSLNKFFNPQQPHPTEKDKQQILSAMSKYEDSHEAPAQEPKAKAKEKVNPLPEELAKPATKAKSKPARKPKAKSRKLNARARKAR